ncbi:hypothetical protein SASC598J21_001650, partial [Snodgrassella alvi SCGC AB-598-J21]
AEKDNDGKWKQTHNSMYDSVYKAGAQGYNLQVNTK